MARQKDFRRHGGTLGLTSAATRRRRVGGAVAAVFEKLETRQMLTAFTATGAIQTFKVQATGEYSLSVAGGQGGSTGTTGANVGGLGVSFTGDVMLNAGTTVDVVVGGQGVVFGNAGGGGGGSFVYVGGASQPLVVAGGGGGAGISGDASPATNGQTGNSGADAPGGGVGYGGEEGFGGFAGSNSQSDDNFSGAGGGGWQGDGQGTPNSTGGSGAPSFAGGTTATANGTPLTTGGFGGGGGVGEEYGGGGGGYSGGGGGGGGSGAGGGGGSYVGASILNTTTAVNRTGNGSVTITGLLTTPDQTVAVVFDTPKPIAFTSVDAASPGATVMYGIATQGAHGIVSALNPKTGTVTYTPTDNYVGADSFTYFVTDGTNTTTGTVTITVASPSTTPWMTGLPDSIPLTDVSLPGTINSAAGPELADALLGSGSVKFLNSPSLTNTATTNAALVAHLAADAASSAAIAAGGANAALNAAAVAANSAALTADAAAGITAETAGAALAIGLTGDVTGLASSIASAAQAAKGAANTTTDTSSQAAGATATTADTATSTALLTAGNSNDAATNQDALASIADAAAGTANGVAGGADDAAGAADAVAGAADASAGTSDVVAAAQGGIDPVADGVAAGLDTAAAVADTAGDAANVAATAGDAAADAADGTASASNAAAITLGNSATAASTAASTSGAAATGPNSAASTQHGEAGTTHTAAATADSAAAAAFVAGATADGYTGNQFQNYAANLYTPETDGGNPNNVTDQNAIHDLAALEATAHLSAATLEAAAALANSAAATANATATSLDAAVVDALAAAEAAIETAVADDTAAITATATSNTADSVAATADEAAASANSTAGGLDATAGSLNSAAGVADGVTAGLDTGAATADAVAIAADALALATVEIPFVDIGTAIAAAAADAAEAIVDATATASDVATGVTDGLATAGDVVAAAADGAVTAADKTAATADATASADAIAANIARSTASSADFAAVRAEASLLIAIKAADAAGKAAESADAAADTSDAAAMAAVDSSIAADISFSSKVQALQATQVPETTQTLDVSDQLAAGIRSLDLRGALVNDTINLNAGSNFTGTSLQDALDDMTAFLHANPSETIVVTLGNESSAINSPKGFNADLNSLLNSTDAAVKGQTYKSFVYYSSNAATTPTLGEVRGKIVFVPSSDKTWTPVADPTTGLQIGWKPTEVDSDSSGLVKTDLGTPTTLYRNNLTADSDANPVAGGDATDALAQTYLGETLVSRTTGIVGMDDPSPTLINEIIGENTAPIIVTSDSDAPGAAGTLREAILQVNSQRGVSTIEFASSLNGSTGNVIVLQSDLPPITNDLDLIGGPTDFLNLNGFAGPAAAGTTHTVDETTFPTSASQTTLTTVSDTTGLYVNIEGLNYGSEAPLSVNPINITYGTALANSQLHGTATVDQNGVTVSISGTYTFTSASGKVLGADNGQSEDVTFTPFANAYGYTTQTGTVIVNVSTAKPAVSTVKAVNISYGTALANSQLSGTATFVVNGKSVTVPGTFVYTAAGTVLYASSNAQPQSVTFTPTDGTDYSSVATSVNVTVAQVTPTVTVNVVNLTPGDTLDNAQITGTATAVVNGATVNVVGTFSYTTAAGTEIGTGSGQHERVTFTPSDTTDFASVTTTAVVNAVQTTPVAPEVSVNAIDLTYGTALANSQLTGSATYDVGGTAVKVAGAFAFTSAGGSDLTVGNGQSEGVTFTPKDTTDYAAVSSTVAVNVTPATPTIPTLNPIGIVYGTALANGQLMGTATAVVNGNTVSVPGTFAFTSAAGSVLGVGQTQLENVTFTPTDNTDYTTASTTVNVNVGQVVPTVTGVTPVNLTYGTALANGQLSGTAVATINGSPTPVAGTFSYVAAGSTPNAGNGRTESVLFTPTDTTDYTTATSSVTVNVAQATPTVSVTDAGGVANGSPYAATGTVTGVNGVSLAAPTFAYYLATDTTFANPLAGAPSAPGRYLVVGSYAASGNYGAGVASTGFTITSTNAAAVNPTIITSAQPATINVGGSIADKVTVTGASPTGAVTFRLYNNPTATGRPLFSDTEMLMNGVATSAAYTTTSTAIGTDYWVAIYTGDSANNPATSADTAAPVTVGASLVVNSIGDGPSASGNTLRDAVAYADTLGAGTHVITFDPTVFASSQIITLNSTLGPLVLSDSSGTTTITGPASGVTISGGNSVGLFAVNSGVTATLSGLSLVDGSAAEGGAINDRGTLTVDHSTLEGNIASGLGGAIIVTGGVTVVDSTFASNTATLSGGAIEDAGSVTVLDSTFSGNQVTTAVTGSGGAIDNGANAYTLKIGDSILTGDSAANGPEVSNSATSLGNNLISETDGSSGWTGSDLTGTIANPLNAMLAPLSNNGGPTQTFALLPSSPALGTGAPLAGVTTDQRGLGRPANAPDIGAYQTEAVVTVIDAGGTYNGDPFPATAVSATGTRGLNDTTLADFTFIYTGTGATVYAASSTAPTNPGTYTVIATYQGDASHASVSSMPTPFTISPAATVTQVTGLTITRGGLVYNARTKTYTQTLTILNTGAELDGPLSLVFTGASGATLSNATGTTQSAHGAAPAGSSYITLPATTLASNGTETLTLTFTGTSTPVYDLLALLGNGVL